MPIYRTGANIYTVQQRWGMHLGGAANTANAVFGVNLAEQVRIQQRFLSPLRISVPAQFLSTNNAYTETGLSISATATVTCTNKQAHKEAATSGAVVYTDNFNRANGDLTSPWVQLGNGTVAIASNQAVLSGGGIKVPYYNATVSNDQFSEITTTLTADSSLGPAVRITDANNFYYIYYPAAASVVQAWKYVGAAGTQLGSNVPFTGTTHTVRLEAQGTTVRLWLDGTKVIEVTDTSLATGKPGLLGNQVGGGPFPFADNWSGGDVGVAAVGGPSLTVVATVTCTDSYHVASQNYNETGRSITIVAATSVTDRAHFHEGAVATAAVRINNGLDLLSRSAAGLSGAFTVAGWFLLDVNVGYYSSFWSIDNAGSYNQLVTDTDGQNLYWASSGGGINTASPLTLGSWYYLACTFIVEGTDTLYRAQGGSAFVLQTVTGMTAANDAWTFYIGNDGFNEYINGRAANVKVWTAALSQVEVEAERWSSAPVRSTNLWGWYPLNGATDTTDHSSNGRHLTASGTIDTTTGPPGLFVYTGLPVNVAATVSCTDTYHVASTNYNETGRSISIAAAITVTAKQGYKEPALSIPIAATTIVADKRGNKEPALSVPTTATVTTTDRRGNKELALSIPVAATVTVTDLIHRKELALPIAVAATCTVVTERSSYKQLALPISVAAIVAVNDAFGHAGNFSDLNLSIPISGAVAVTTLAHNRESVTVTTTGAVTTTDRQGHKEPARSLLVTATVSTVDASKRRELALSIPVVATTTLSVDRAGYKNLSASLLIVCFVTATDLQQSSGHYDETQRSILVVSSVTTVDRASFKDTGSPGYVYFPRTVTGNHVGASVNNVDVDASGSCRVECEVSDFDSLVHSPIGGNYFLLYLPYSAVDSFYGYFYNSSAAPVGTSVQRVTANASGVPNSGKWQFKINWNAATDTLSVLHRSPALGYDLLDDTGWIQISTGVKAGEQLRTGPISQFVNNAGFRGSGPVWRAVAEINGTTFFDFDFRYLNADPGTTMVLPTGQIATVTRNATTPLTFTPQQQVVPIAATVTCTDSKRYVETSLPIAVTATTTLTARRHTFEPVSLPIAATTTLTDQADYEDHPLVLAVAATITVTDLRRLPVENLTILGVGVVSVTARASFRQLALPVAGGVTVSAADSLSAFVLLPILIAARITCTDARSRVGIVKLNEAQALYLGIEAVDAVYVGADRVWPP